MAVEGSDLAGVEVGEEVLVEPAGLIPALRRPVGLPSSLASYAKCSSITWSVDDVFAPASTDPRERVMRVEEAVSGTLLAHERAMRVIVRNALDTWIAGSGGDDHAFRRGRRNELIEVALEPLVDELDAEVLDLLRYSLALTIGTEAMIAAHDVSGLDEERARAVAKWETEALVARALDEQR